MPVAPVDSVGTVLYYEDSGVPLGDSLYTSIVLSHGAAFHSGVFHRMVPYAAQNNLRLFLVNSRDYPGSSPFSPAEFDALGSSDRLVQAKAIQKQGVELAAFLIYLIEEHDIPPITTLGDGTLTGGLAVLSWSLGTLVPTAFLAHADALPTKTQHRLQSHLRSVVLLDPSLHTTGEPLPTFTIGNPSKIPPGLYQPFVDPAMTPERLVKEFPVFASTYWTPVSDLSSLTMGTLALRVPIHSSENNYSIRDPTPSVKRMTAEEFHGMTDMEAFSRIPLAVGKVDLKVFRDNFIRALWEDEDPVTHEILNTKGKSPPLPRVKLLVIWGDMTIIDCVLAASAISKHVVAGHVQRRIEIEKIEGANHFFHWDFPEHLSQFLFRHV